MPSSVPWRISLIFDLLEQEFKNTLCKPFLLVRARRPSSGSRKTLGASGLSHARGPDPRRADTPGAHRPTPRCGGSGHTPALAPAAATPAAAAAAANGGIAKEAETVGVGPREGRGGEAVARQPEENRKIKSSESLFFSCKMLSIVIVVSKW